MFFNSFDFAVFFPTVFVLYWIFAKYKIPRNVLLLVASYVFYGWWDWRFLFLIIISSSVDFFIGQYIYGTTDPKKRKAFLLVSLVVNLGFLLYFKYTNFFIDTFVDSFRLFGKTLEISTLNIILPVGISFYTFQTLSYTIDIYRKQLKPTKDALAFFTFVAFFPQLVAGPIERATHLLPQFYKTHKFNYERIKSGLLLMAFGLFKKMVIADRVAILVNQVYNNPGDYSGFEIITATLFFAFQIYCDFSGYSDIAIGIARTMGFDLMKNFDSPYFSKSITEFWRRWHISLSTWFRDYVYIPLGGSRDGKYKTYLNLFLVFLISGLWHGANMTFVIWGSIHGVIIVLEKATSNFRKKLFTSKKLIKNSLLGNVLFSMVTFIIVCFAWIFFRANNTKDAMDLISNSTNIKFSGLIDGSLFKIGLEQHEFFAALGFIFILLFIEKIHNRRSVTKVLNNLVTPFRWSVYICLVMIVIVFGIYGDGQESEFIYFQF